MLELCWVIYAYRNHKKPTDLNYPTDFRRVEEWAVEQIRDLS